MTICFSVLNKDGSLAPRFVMVSNIETKDHGIEIIKGNERVLKARLADAKFFGSRIKDTHWKVVSIL